MGNGLWVTVDKLRLISVCARFVAQPNRCRMEDSGPSWVGPGMEQLQCVIYEPGPPEASLYITGGTTITRNPQALSELQIGGLIRLGSFTYHVPSEVEALTIPVGDGPEDDLTAHLPGLIGFIQRHLEEVHDSVVVHCGGGVSRSGAVVVAYVMWKHRIAYDEALALVRECRPCVRPNRSFARQLQQFQFDQLELL